MSPKREATPAVGAKGDPAAPASTPDEVEDDASVLSDEPEAEPGDEDETVSAGGDAAAEDAAGVADVSDDEATGSEERAVDGESTDEPSESAEDEPADDTADEPGDEADEPVEMSGDEEEAEPDEPSAPRDETVEDEGSGDQTATQEAAEESADGDADEDLAEAPEDAAEESQEVEAEDDADGADEDVDAADDTDSDTDEDADGDDRDVDDAVAETGDADADADESADDGPAPDTDEPDAGDGSDDEAEAVDEASDDRSEDDADGTDAAPVVHETAASADAAPDPAEEDAPEAGHDVVIVENVIKEFGITRAVGDFTLRIPAGAFFGVVGPNGAGKTTLLSMITGLLRPDSGRVLVHGHDVWADPDGAKRALGVLPDRLRLFDRLTGRQFLYYSGTLRGLDRDTVRTRSAELATAFGLDDALGRLVSDYSAGMTKKVAIAAAMIHSPRLLVLDEPFEGVDPVSAQTVIDILQRFVNAGGTVLLSSHSMETIERVCTRVAVIVQGELRAEGTVEEVSAEGSLEERFLELAGVDNPAESMEWLLSSSG